MSTYSVIIYPGSKVPETYLPAIIDRWTTSFRNGNPFYKDCLVGPFYKRWRAYVRELLLKPEMLIRLAVLTDDPDILLGFSAIRGEILDYVHVLSEHRLKKIGHYLVPLNDIKVFTHKTQTGNKIWKLKYKELKFNPFT